jgi:hypothetical protein
VNVQDAAASLARSRRRPWALRPNSQPRCWRLDACINRTSPPYGDKPRVETSALCLASSATITAVCRLHSVRHKQPPCAVQRPRHSSAACFAISDSIVSAPPAAPALVIETGDSIASPHSHSLAHQPTAAVLLPARVALGSSAPSWMPMRGASSLSIFNLRRQPNHGFVQLDSAE